MVISIGFLGRFLRPVKRHPGLPYMNVDRALSDLSTWFNGRADMDLPMLFALEGAPAVGKSALAEVMASEGDSVHGLDIEQLGTDGGRIPPGTTTVLVDDADQGNPTDLLESVSDLLGKGVAVILFVQTLRRVTPELLAKAGTGSITRDGVRLDRHQALEKKIGEHQAHDQ
jgi:hypothetical protein